MITQITWYQDLPNAFDITVCGIGGSGGASTGAGCSLHATSPSGIWQIRSNDFIMRDGHNQINFQHMASAVRNVPLNTEFVVDSYAELAPNASSKMVQGAQSGVLQVAGWTSKQTIVLVSQTDPQNTGTWTWLVNYNGRKL